MKPSILGLKIAEVPFSLSCVRPIEVGTNFQPFLCEEQTDGWQICYSYSDVVRVPDGTCLLQSLEYCVYQDEAGKCLRLFTDPKREGLPYALTQINEDKKLVTVRLIPGSEEYFSDTGNCLFHSDWEQIMNAEGRLFLHASAIDTPYGGVLFSGPSGIGKTTQSRLWEEYEQAETINGDRPILWKNGGIWRAYGSPYAGSSRCHVDKYCEVKCLAMLEQAKTCSIRQLSHGEAFRQVFSMTTAYPWNQTFMNRAADLVLQLVSEVPVYRLSCTPDRNAVEILKEKLRG